VVLNSLAREPLRLIDERAVDCQCDVFSDMLEQFEFFARECVRGSGSDVENAEQALADEQGYASDRSNALTQDGIGCVKGCEIGNYEELTRGGDASGKAMANWNIDSPCGLFLKAMRCANQQILAIRCTEQYRDVVHVHDVLDGIEERWE
jgi:hypothetical protein